MAAGGNSWAAPWGSGLPGRLHDFVKTVLLQQLVSPGAAVCDLLCGRGTDTSKFGAASIGSYVGLDLSASALQDAEEEWRNLGKPYAASFCQLDPFLGDLESKLQDKELPFDTVCCLGHLQDSFSSEDKVKQLLENVASLLKFGGIFFGITADGSTLWSKYQKAVESALKTGTLRPGSTIPRVKADLYTITFDDDRFNIFGTRYQLRFVDDGLAPQSQLLVHFPSLIRLAKEAGLEYIEIQNLDEFFEDYRHLFADAFASNCSSFLDPKGKLMVPVRDVLSLYTTFIFRKAESYSPGRQPLQPIYDMRESIAALTAEVVNKVVDQKPELRSFSRRSHRNNNINSNSNNTPDEKKKPVFRKDAEDKDKVNKPEPVEEIKAEPVKELRTYERVQRDSRRRGGGGDRRSNQQKDADPEPEPTKPPAEAEPKRADDESAGKRAAERSSDRQNDFSSSSRRPDAEEDSSTRSTRRPDSGDGSRRSSKRGDYADYADDESGRLGKVDEARKSARRPDSSEDSSRRSSKRDKDDESRRISKTDDERRGSSRIDDEPRKSDDSRRRAEADDDWRRSSKHTEVYESRRSSSGKHVDDGDDGYHRRPSSSSRRPDTDDDARKSARYDDDARRSRRTEAADDDSRRSTAKRPEPEEDSRRSNTKRSDVADDDSRDIDRSLDDSSKMEDDSRRQPESAGAEEKPPDSTAKPDEPDAASPPPPPQPEAEATSTTSTTLPPPSPPPPPPRPPPDVSVSEPNPGEEPAMPPRKPPPVYEYKRRNRWASKAYMQQQQQPPPPGTFPPPPPEMEIRAEMEMRAEMEAYQRRLNVPSILGPGPRVPLVFHAYRRDGSRNYNKERNFHR